MRAGKVASLGLVLIVAAAGTALSHFADASWLLSLSVPARLAVTFGLLAAACAALLLPLGAAIDRIAGRLRSYLEASGSTDGQAAFYGPRWARPITGAFLGAVDQFRTRERALGTALREEEIRRRVSEAERRQTEEVLHALRDGVLVTNAFGDVVVANEAVGRILGFEHAKALRRPLEEFVKDRRLCQLIRDTLETANFAERRHVEHEIRIAPGRGGGKGEPEAKVFDVTLACVENHKHDVAGVVTILHDLTRVREISQMKSDFVSKASHELRTPLSSIRAYVEMLVDGEADDEAARQEFYRIIQNETDRLGRLIDNMLNISRIEAGIVQIERKNVDFKTLIGRALETLEPQAREKRMTLITKVAEVDLTVEGDEDMLYQVVLNLVSNAVKYTPDGGRVTVAADSDNLTRCVVFSVTDTGLGIPPDAIPKLFDKFYRVENYKRVAKGTGLGLSLCKHIVETLHHGQIGVESKLGMGSKFWVSIPMRYAGSQAAA